VDLYPEDRHKELCVQLSFGLAYIIAQRLVQRSDGKGRRIALEVLKNSYAVSAIIRAGNWQQLYGVMETQMKDGMLTCEKHLALLFKSGQIDRQEALSQANDPIALAQLI
jgi:Tfp pilus assembly ATPase PilU